MSRRYSIKNRGNKRATVVIERLLPNPDGTDRINEEVILRNDSASAVSMAGWTLEDESGRIWALVSLGSLNPGQSAAIKRNAMPMSLDNDGDKISLFNASHQLVDRFEYTGSQQGVWVETGH